MPNEFMMSVYTFSQTVGFIAPINGLYNPILFPVQSNFEHVNLVMMLLFISISSAIVISSPLGITFIELQILRRGYHRGSK